MAQYDVYKNPTGAGWILDLQTDLLNGLNTRVVVPLMMPRKAPTPAARLNPILNVAGQEAFMMTQFLAAVPQSILKDPIASQIADHDNIVNATDMLFHGF